MEESTVPVPWKDPEQRGPSRVVKEAVRRGRPIRKSLERKTDRKRRWQGPVVEAVERASVPTLNGLEETTDR